MSDACEGWRHVSQLLHERDEARAELEQWKDAADEFVSGVDTVARLTRERNEARALLREAEWLGPKERKWCRFCRRFKVDGHAPDCRLASALKGGER